MLLLLLLLLQEPFLAVVVDPVRTMASGKVEIGAFRTYPEGYKPPDEGPSEYQTIPLSKIEDFGVHAKQVRQVAAACSSSSSSNRG
jgi:COP9 signalosome complex subunit 5